MNAPSSSLRLHILSGPSAGQSVAWNAGTWTIGRATTASVPIPEDLQVSSRHAQIAFEGGQWILSDLQSRNGTFVNGNRVHRSALCDGDEILVGTSRLGIELDRDPSSRDASARRSLPNADSAEAHRGTASRVPQSPSRAHLVKAQAQPLGEVAPGIQAVEGGWGTASPARASIAWLDAWQQAGHRVYLLVDPLRADLSWPESWDAAQSCLYDWLPAEAASLMPCLVPPDELPGWPEAAGNAWGKDAWVALCSKCSRPDLLAHVRRAVRVWRDALEPPNQILGIVWPSVLQSLLLVNSEGFSERWMAPLDAAWMEMAEASSRWRLFGTAAAIRTCERLGVRILDSAPIANP